MTDHLHVRIAWIRRRLPVPRAPFVAGLHDSMRTVRCWNGLISSSLSPPIDLAIDHRSCFIYNKYDKIVEPIASADMTDVGREVVPTAQLGRGKASGIGEVRGYPLITRALSVAGTVPRTCGDCHRITPPRTWETSVTHQFGVSPRLLEGGGTSLS